MNEAFNALLEAQSEKDPSFASGYERELQRIKTYDWIINAIDEKRRELGMTKKVLAKTAGVPYSSVRRLFASSSEVANPTFSTLADLASSVGLTLTLQPLESSSAPQSSGLDRTASV